MSGKPLLPTLSAGLLVAATGVGAGDLVISALAGARYGYTLLWAIAVGAVLKFFLNEGLARWELATGTTLLEGWVERLPRYLVIYFGVYLCFWACLVAGTLISYTGLVAHTLLPLPLSDAGGTAVWGALHSVVALLLVRFGGFCSVEVAMKVVISIMFVIVIGCAVAVLPPAGEVLRGVLLPTLPADRQSVLFSLALIGGVGGTLTIMCYAYWLREKRALDEVSLRGVRLDLGVAYFLTALFGIAVTVIAAQLRPEDVGGYRMVTGLAEQLATILGEAGYWVFLLGFWAAVFTSMVGVWSGVPYLFADLWQRYRRRYAAGPNPVAALRTTAAYPYFLLYLALPPVLLTIYQQPAWIGIAYAVSGAAFMPFLAGTLLYLNNRKAWVRPLHNGWLTNAVLGVSLLLFLILLATQLAIPG
ncbi:Mn2+/Fe2+ NRAMP family transporter [Neolewinella xylanilytica]|uniref:Mn2+/Fe2+ NRAMP family transporter n=1 Tax=Neolewinella xylanilytica TaxID=1514080 RepID=A0A2S6IAR4_9BACT|nr:Nramp family divalent metal transporter [Neolewinella xylanilytica]PPK88594.1 Mn2+/Fe2+ NRAMP family transporter [Neolewinella xylanilytica]